MSVALINMDGILVDYYTAMRIDLASIAGPYDEPLINRYQFDDPWMRKRIHLIRSQPGWWRNLPLLGVGSVIINMLFNVGYDVNILIKKSSTFFAWTEKREWCREHFPKIPVMIAEDVVYGEILVDNDLINIKDWLKERMCGRVIIPVLPWNQDNFIHPRVIYWELGVNDERIRRMLVELRG